MTSIADYNNNPGNLKPKGFTYEGQIGLDDQGFAIFATKDAGRSALIQDIQAKQKQGLNTPHSFIDKYTPAMVENPEDARDNYKIRMAQYLGLKSTTDPFPEGSEQKIADLIASVEGGQPIEGTEGKKKFVPVADTFSDETTKKDETSPPPKPREDAVSPITGVVAGAGASTLGQAPFTSELQTAKPPPDLASYEDAERKARIRAEVALDRLNQRASSNQPILTGSDIPTLEAEYQRTQALLQQAERELQAATTAQKAKAPPTPPKAAVTVPAAGSMASATPQIVTDPNVPVSRTATEQMMQGTIDPETGTTGRQRQNYNEVTSFQKLQREEQEKALLEASKSGVVPDKGQRARLAFGMPDATPSGIIVQPEVAAPLKEQQEIEQKMADDRAAQERKAQLDEIDRLKNERALAAQEHSVAQRNLNDAKQAKTTGVTRAQTAAEGRSDMMRVAQIEAAAARNAAKNAPGLAERALQNTGVKIAKSNPLFKGALGAFGGYEAVQGINDLANLPLSELKKRWDAGDRSQALMDALGNVAMATSQTGLGAAAAMPAFGPMSAKIKGAGTIGTLGLAGLRAWNEAQQAAAKKRQTQ